MKREKKMVNKPEAMPALWMAVADDLAGAGAASKADDLAGAAAAVSGAAASLVSLETSLNGKSLPDEPFWLTTLTWSFWPASQCLPTPL